MPAACYTAGKLFNRKGNRMRTSLKGNMVIAQSGGPSMVINASLIGAVLAAKKSRLIKNIYGSRHGIKGVLEEKMIDLRRESDAALAAVAQTASAALGSVRKKPTEEECVKIFSILQKYDVRYFFYIGGNDSAETVHIIHEEARKADHDLRCFHIPKTIDNDLLENDHTPGYGSAAKFVACAVMGDNLDNRALPGVKVDVVMGRHAGFLTAAAALGRAYPDDGPHLIYVPERPFAMAKFMADVKTAYDRFGRCVIAVSEGIADENGDAIASKFIKETDAHGNIQLSGTGALGDLLADEIKTKLQISRVRADTFGYLQRSFPGIVSAVDAREARAVGALAVTTAMHGELSGSIAIRRRPGKKYQVYFERVPLQSVAKNTRRLPDEFINSAGNNVTAAFLNYARPLVGALPQVGRFKGIPVKKPG